METDLVERPAPPVRVEAHIALHPAPAVASGRPFALERAGWQCLPVSAHIRERYLVTFRAPADAPSFLTLRSDVSARPLAVLGRTFSHYRPHLARMQRDRGAAGFKLVCRSRDGIGDADFEAAPAARAENESAIFTDVAEAAVFMLGMRFSVDVRPGGRLRAQQIDHDPWGARLATPTRRWFAYIESLARTIGAPLVYDHTLVMRDLRQVWRAARWI